MPDSRHTADHAHDHDGDPRGGSLDAFFGPRSVALIGATDKPGSVGRAIFENLRASSFGGPLYAVNPNRDAVLGTPCHHGIPADVDLAIIVIPAPCVPDAIRDCAAAGVRAAVIISAGFREMGPEGRAREAAILDITCNSSLRIIGPNCVGVMNPYSGLNATFAASMAKRGHIALISQSGAICTAILDWSQQENVGFSSFVSTGSMADVEWGDLIEHLGRDPNTRCILAYMESVPNPQRFMAAAKKVAPSKPIIILKPGRTAAAARAAASHTGALTSRDDVLDAVFERCGVLRVNTIAELFNLAEALDKQPRPKGPRLTIVTNAGGVGVLATDALLASGGALTELAPDTLAQLDAVLPAHWSHQNPIDILGDADHTRFAQAMRIAAADPSTDGVLVALAPQAMTDPAAVAEEVARLQTAKPVLASWMGGPAIARGEAILNAAHIPTYRYADAAARVFQTMWQHTQNLHVLDQHPEPCSTVAPHPVIARAQAAGRTLLSEAESKQLLGDHGIPTTPTEVAHSAAAAIAAAERFGYPVVLKVHSETITHKTDVGGVRLNLTSADQVRDAYNAIAAAVPAQDFLGVTVQPMVRTDGYELILGSSTDPQFGPVLLFGAGGVLVEVYKDRALGLPPLTPSLARRMIDHTRIATALRGIRGRAPIDLNALDQVLVRFARLVLEQPAIYELDINPLLASPQGLLALDARVVLKTVTRASF